MDSLLICFSAEQAQKIYKLWPKKKNSVETLLIRSYRNQTFLLSHKKASSFVKRVKGEREQSKKKSDWETSLLCNAKWN